MSNADGVLESQGGRTTSAILRSETNLRQMLDASPFPIIVTARDNGHVLYINRLMSVLFGYAPQEVQGKPAPALFVNPADREHLLQLIDREGTVDDFEAVLKDESGRQFYAQVSASRVDYEGREAVFLSFSDITRRKEIETELMRLAATDGLTGLSNRRAFFEQGEREMARARRYDKPLSVLMLDIDRFKLVNDTHGHAAGDEILRQLSGVIRGALRETDIIGRIGGEEFAAILPETALQGATETAERLRKAVVTSPCEYEGIRIHYSASIGVSDRRPQDANLHQILKRADDAMYGAKTSGRNRVIRD